jgi:hypothetical protein
LRELVQLGQPPWYNLDFLRLVPLAAFLVEVPGQDHLGDMAEVAGGQCERADLKQLVGAVAHLFLQLTVGCLLRGFIAIDASLGQGQLIAVYTGGILANQQHGVLVIQGHHQHGAAGRGAQSFIYPDGAVDEADVEPLDMKQTRSGDCFNV